MSQPHEDDAKTHRMRVIASTGIGRVLGCECGGTRILEIGPVSLRFDSDALRSLEALLGLANARDAVLPRPLTATLDPRSLS